MNDDEEMPPPPPPARPDVEKVFKRLTENDRKSQSREDDAASS